MAELSHREREGNNDARGGQGSRSKGVAQRRAEKDYGERAVEVGSSDYKRRKG